MKEKKTTGDKAMKQYEGWMGEAMRILGEALPQEDEGLDDTRSFADIVDIAERARAIIAEQKECIVRLADKLGCVRRGEAEMEEEVADIAKAAKAWAALMDRARDYGFSEIADADPVIMAGTYIMAVDEVMRERDKLKAELRETRERFAQTQPVWADTASATVNDALLEWARKQIESGKLAVRVKVIDLEEAA